MLPLHPKVMFLLCPFLTAQWVTSKKPTSASKGGREVATF